MDRIVTRGDDIDRSRSVSAQSSDSVSSCRASTPLSPGATLSRAATISLLDMSDVELPELDPSQLCSQDLDETGDGQESDVAAIKELKSLLVSLESFYVFDKYVKTETNADGRKIYTGKAKCQQKMCRKVITFDNKTRGNLKKHYDSVHKDLAKNLAAAIYGLNKRGRSKYQEDFPAKRTGRQLCLEEPFSSRNKFRPDVAGKLWNSMELKEVVAVLDRLAAPSLAESWDNVGLLLQPYTQREVKTVFLTNDLSEDVMAEAVEQKADLILSYHPPLFRPFKRITTGWKDRIIACCLEKGIAVYSPHTAYDTLKGGVNDWLLKAFDVQGVTPLQQKDVSPPYSHQVEANSAHVPATEDFEQKVTQEFGEKVSVVSNGGKCAKVLCDEQALPTIVNLANRSPEPPKLVVTKLEKVPLFEHGAGRRAGLRESITIQEAISRVKTHLGLPHIRVAVAQGSKLDSQVKTVAVCAGSGASVLRGAAADLWLTGEMSHHEVLDAAHNGTTVILVDHSNSERGFLKGELQPTLHQLFAGKVNVLVSQQDRDPLQVL